MGVPLIKGGAFVAGLAVHNASPRAWTADEVALVEETAERTWAAVERARVEQALREREEQLQAALEGGQLGAWAWNPATNQSQVDGVTLELFGLDLDQPAVDVASVFAQIHPEDLPAVAAALAAVQQPGGEYRAEFRVRLPDGRERWIAGLGRGRFENGTVQRVYGVNFDITSRKRAEADTRLLAQLGARISVAEDAEALQEGVVRLVGEHLQVAHCCFAEIDMAHDRWFVRHEWYDRTLSLAGDRRISDYPPAFVETLQRGELLICADATLDPLATTRYTQAYAPIGVRAYVVVPLLRQRQWVSTLMVLQPSPREWKEAEIALLQTVAERTWQAVERARAERALRESEARLQLALDSTGMGTFVWHLAEDRAEPDVRLLAHFGLPPDSTTSPSEALATLVYLEDRAPYAAAVQRATDPDGDGRLYAEVRAMQPDGSLRWLAVIGQTFFDGMPRQALRVAGMIGDISERKQIEARLAAAAVRDQYLVRLADALRPLSNASAIEAVATRVLGEQLGATRVAYFEVDGEDYVASHYYSVGVESPAGRFSSTSFGPEQLATYRAGRTVIEPDVAANPTLTPADRETYATYQIAAHVGVPLVKDRRFVAGLAVHQTTPRAWTADEVALIEETAERTWAAIERARAEARLQALFAQEQAARRAAEEASRLKDEFLATVSHELRTPLTAFLGYASLLQRRQRDEAYVRRAVEKMVQSAQAQAALIEDLLDVSRVIGGKLRIEPEPIELIDVVHAALDTVRPTLESRGLTLDLALDPAASAVFGDASRLQQVVWNLLSNAAKFSRAGGRITVQLTRVADDAELSVHDTGQGIDPVFLPFVFDRFRQADSTSQRVHGGLGLGLAIVRHLVELHGGTVMASSAGVGQGATFIVRLPLAMTSNQQELRSAMDTASAEVVHTALLPLRGVQVLVVDDQPAILELLEELLTTDGATVRACSSTAEALALVDEWRPDVLVSDIAMPGEDGYQLIEQLRSRPVDAGGSIPAVALTAYVRMEDRLRVLAAGFQQYVTKPVDAAELRDVILHLITTRQEPSSASQ